MPPDATERHRYRRYEVFFEVYLHPIFTLGAELGFRKTSVLFSGLS